MSGVRKVKEKLNLMHKNLECAICLELLKNPVSTKCDHQFCRFCITKFFENKRYVPCPLCKIPISKRSLQERSELGNIADIVKELSQVFQKEADAGHAIESTDVVPKPSKTETAPKHLLDSSATDSQLLRFCKQKSNDEKSTLPKSDDITPSKRTTRRSTRQDLQLDAADEDVRKNYLSKSLEECTSSPGTKKRNHSMRNGKLRSKRYLTSDENPDTPEQWSVTSKEDEKSKELLKYLEEGSCGAVKSLDESPQCLYQEEVNSVDNLNDVEKSDHQGQAPNTNKNPKSLCPISSSKTIKEIPFPNENLMLPTQVKDSSCNKTPNGSPVTTAGLGKSTPDSETASFSSTQQLSKPVQAVSRTYAKDMRSQGKAEGFIKNWIGTLPSPSNITPKLTGLTTKEKIAAKKQKSLLTVAPVSNSTVGDKNASFDIAEMSAPRPKRKCIFKTRAAKESINTELNVDHEEAHQCTPVSKQKEADPYEFVGGHTPDMKTQRASKKKSNVTKSKDSGKQGISSYPRLEVNVSKETTNLSDTKAVEKDKNLNGSFDKETYKGNKCQQKKVHFVDAKDNFDSKDISVSLSPDGPRKNLTTGQEMSDLSRNNKYVSEIQDMTSSVDGDCDSMNINVALDNASTVSCDEMFVFTDLNQNSFDKRSTSKEAMNNSRKTKLSPIENKNEPNLSKNPTHLRKIAKRGSPAVAVEDEIVGKRTLSRRRKRTSPDGDGESAQLEMKKLANKIYEAEDHDLAFSTQEAHMKMQKEQARQKQYEESFGFDNLHQEQELNSKLKHQIPCRKATEQLSHTLVVSDTKMANTDDLELESCGSVSGISETMVESDALDTDSMKTKFNGMDIKPVNMKDTTGNFGTEDQKDKETVIAETPMSLNESTDIEKCKKTSAETDICPITEIDTCHVMESQHRPETSQITKITDRVDQKLTKASVSSKSHFSRPDLSLMVQISPSSKTCATYSGLVGKPLFSKPLPINAGRRRQNEKAKNHCTEKFESPKLSGSPSIVLDTPLQNGLKKNLQVTTEDMQGVTNGRSMETSIMTKSTDLNVLPSTSMISSGSTHSMVSASEQNREGSFDNMTHTPDTDNRMPVVQTIRTRESADGKGGEKPEVRTCAVANVQSSEVDTVLAPDTCYAEEDELCRIDTEAHPVVKEKCNIVEETQDSETGSDMNAVINELHKDKQTSEVNTSKYPNQAIYTAGISGKDGISHQKEGSQMSCIIIESNVPQSTGSTAKKDAHAADPDLSDVNSLPISQSLLQVTKSTNKSLSGNMTTSLSGATTVIPPTATQEVNIEKRKAADSGDKNSMNVYHELPCKRKKIKGKQLVLNSAPEALNISDTDDDDDDIMEDVVLISRRQKGRSFSFDDQIVQPVVYKETEPKESQAEEVCDINNMKTAGIEMIGETQALVMLDTDSQDAYINDAEERDDIPESVTTTDTVVETVMDYEEGCEPLKKLCTIETVPETEEVQITSERHKNNNIESELRCDPVEDGSNTAQEVHDIEEEMRLPVKKSKRGMAASSTLEAESEICYNLDECIRQGKARQDVQKIQNKVNVTSVTGAPQRTRKSKRSANISDLSADFSGTTNETENILDLSHGSCSSGTKRRTRRGLAARLALDDPTPNRAKKQGLSDTAQASINKCMQDVRSKIEFDNSEKKRKYTEQQSQHHEVIDVDGENIENNVRKVQVMKVNNKENWVEDYLSTVKDSNASEVTSVQIMSPEKTMCEVKRGNTKSHDSDQDNQDKENFNRLGPSAAAVSNQGSRDEESDGVSKSVGKIQEEENDKVMADLKACFVSSDEDDENEIDKDKHAKYTFHRRRLTVHKDTLCMNSENSNSKFVEADAREDDQCENDANGDSCPTPLTSSPLNEAKENSQPEALEQSVINGIAESSCEEDDNDEDKIGSTGRGKKRLRQQITSDSESADEENSQSRSSVSSVHSSQVETMSTQQARALEKDVDKLNKEIAEYEAKLGVLPAENPVSSDDDDSDDNDSDDEDEEADSSQKKTDSASLCKRFPDVFAVDDSPDKAGHPNASSANDKKDEEDSDDLFVSPLSSSPPSSRKSKRPSTKRARKGEKQTQMSDHFIKQFQSPGGTVRSKKQLDFVQNQGNELSQITVDIDPQKDVSTGKETEVEESQQGLASPVLSSQKTNRQSQKKELSKILTIEEPHQTTRLQICFVTSGLSKEENAITLAFAKKFGAKFSPKFSGEVTHVIMKTESYASRVCDRTLKFFQGVAHKCWVVSYSWAKSSMSTNKLLPEIDFEITGDTSAGDFAGGARLSRESKQKLFSDFCFACVGCSQEMPKESLFDLLTVCGAGCVEDPIGLLSKAVKYKIIVRCSDSDNEPSSVEMDMFNGLYKHMGLLTVMREWILDSLGSYTLLPLAGYVINTVEHVSVPF